MGSPSGDKAGRSKQRRILRHSRGRGTLVHGGERPSLTLHAGTAPSWMVGTPAPWPVATHRLRYTPVGAGRLVLKIAESWTISHYYSRLTPCRRLQRRSCILCVLVCVVAIYLRPCGATAAVRALRALGEFSPEAGACLLYTSPSPRDQRGSRMPSSA